MLQLPAGVWPEPVDGPDPSETSRARTHPPLGAPALRSPPGTAAPPRGRCSAEPRFGRSRGARRGSARFGPCWGPTTGAAPPRRGRSVRWAGGATRWATSCRWLRRPMPWRSGSQRYSERWPGSPRHRRAGGPALRPDPPRPAADPAAPPLAGLRPAAAAWGAAGRDRPSATWYRRSRKQHHGWQVWS